MSSCLGIWGLTRPPIAKGLLSRVFIDSCQNPDLQNSGSRLHPHRPLGRRGAQKAVLAKERNTRWLQTVAHRDSPCALGQGGGLCICLPDLRLSRTHHFRLSGLKSEASNLLRVILVFRGGLTPTLNWWRKSPHYYLKAFTWSVTTVPSMCTSLWLQIFLFIFTPALLWHWWSRRCMFATTINVVYHRNAHCQHPEYLSPRRGLKLIKLHLAEDLVKYSAA